MQYGSANLSMGDTVSFVVPGDGGGGGGERERDGRNHLQFKSQALVE